MAGGGFSRERLARLEAAAKAKDMDAIGLALAALEEKLRDLQPLLVRWSTEAAASR